MSVMSAVVVLPLLSPEYQSHEFMFALLIILLAPNRVVLNVPHIHLPAFVVIRLGLGLLLSLLDRKLIVKYHLETSEISEKLSLHILEA